MSITLSPSLANSEGPRWRWKLAEKIVRGQATADDVDHYVLEAVALRKYLDGQQAAGAQSAVFAPHPTVEAAYRIFHENGVVRWQIEAYVLARLSDLEIGSLCGISPDVIIAYLAVFFDVIDHLTDCNWLMRYVIGHAPHQGFRENDVRPFWAWMGMSGGPEFLKTLILNFLAALRPGDQPVMSVYFRPTIPVPVQATAATVVLGMSPESLPIVEKYHDRVDRAMMLRKPKKRRIEVTRAINDLVRVARPLLDGSPLPTDTGGLTGGSKGRGRSVAHIALPILYPLE